MTNGALRVGFDLVQLARIQASIAQFGDRFLCRLFTPDELAYCGYGGELRLERLAARFAAKEAVIKAMQWSEEGIGWTDIEVQRLPSGDCTVQLHGRARAAMLRTGAAQIAVSLSHEGDYAGACVIVQFNP